MTEIYGRSAWGAFPPNHVVPAAHQVDYFVVHHAAGAQPASIAESIMLTQRYQQQHLNTWTCPVNKHQFVDYTAPTWCPTHPDQRVIRTYSDIAYNMVAGWDCAMVGRGANVLDGATDTDPTTFTWSCCVLGDYTQQTLPPEIRAGLITALTVGMEVWGGRPLRPHYDFYATACPGFNLANELPSIEAELYGGDEMTDADMRKLAQYIVDAFFTRPVTVTDGEPPVPYPTNVEGLEVFKHRELQLIRRAVTD